MVLSSDRSVGDIGRELGVEWSAIRFGPLTGPLVLRWQAQRAEPHKTAGDEVGAVGLEPTTVLPCKPWSAVRRRTAAEPTASREHPAVQRRPAPCGGGRAMNARWAAPGRTLPRTPRAPSPKTLVGTDKPGGIVGVDSYDPDPGKA